MAREISLVSSKEGAVLFFFFLKMSRGYDFFAREVGLGFVFFFCVSPHFCFSLPPFLYMAGGLFIYKISTCAIQGNIAIIITEIVFYNQHQQILYVWYLFCSDYFL